MSTVLEEDRPTRLEIADRRSQIAGFGLWSPRSQVAIRTGVALVVAIGLALRGQQLITHREYPLDGPIFYAAAIGLFLWGVSRWADAGPVGQMSLPLPAEWTAGRSLVANAEYRLWFGVASAMFTVLAYRGFAGNRFSTIGVATWLAALGCFLLAVAERPATNWRARFARWIRSDSWSLRVTWVGVVLIGITLVAIFFRTYRLAGVPAEMTSDHAEKLLDVNDVLHGARRIFFPRNTGREALQFYLTAALIRFTPLTISHLALKVGTALFGIIVVPLTFLLGQELYNRDVGLLAAVFLAMSQWHIAITRVGLRFPFTAAFAVPTLYFLFRAFKHNRRNDWLACGLVLGAGLHSYTTLRMVPLLLIALVGIKLLFDLAPRVRGRLAPAAASITTVAVETSALSTRFWVNSLVGGLASLLVFLPLLRFMRDDPKAFWFRVLSRSSDVERQLPADTWHVFWGNVKSAMLMFNYQGDTVWVNTVPGEPVLNWVTGSLFVLGVAYVVWRFVQHGDRRGIYVLLALFGLLLPSILSLAYPQENPSVVRAGGAVPIAALLAALPLYVTADGLRRGFGQASAGPGAGRWAAGLLTAVLLIVAARSTYEWYFVKYDQQYRMSAWNSTEMGEVVRGFADSIGDMTHAYHVAYPHWVDTRNIGINAGDITWNNAILDIEQVRGHANEPAPKLYLLHVDDQKSLSVLQSLFPGGRVTRYQSATPTKDFLVFFVPGRLGY
ncbi:MAG: ArnT family glycosyltransferase [Anaerolineae bacterium]